MSSNEEKQSYQSKKTSWINWFIPLLLILVALAFLLYYPASSPNQDATTPTTQSSSQESEFSAKGIANSLVSTFFNGTDEDKNEQIRALESTLVDLNEQHSSPSSTNAITSSTASKALQTLRDSNLNQAIETLIEAANQQTDPRNAAETWINIGNIQNLTSAPQALLAYQRARELDPNNSNAWNRKGHIHRQLKQLEKAEIAYKKVQQLNTQSTENQAVSLVNFGLLNQSKGNYQAAEGAFLKSLKIYSEHDDDAGIASTSENLASLYKHKNELKKAEAYYLKALQMHQKLAHTQQMASTHAALGALYQSTKNIDKARQHYQYALDISLNNNLQGDIANLYSNLGIIAEQSNQPNKSKDYFEKSLLINQQIKRSAGTADQYSNLATLNRKQQNYAAAEDFHKKAIQIHTQNKHKNGIISQQINLGFLYKVWNKTDKACEIWKSSLALLQNDQSKRTERVVELIKTNCP